MMVLVLIKKVTSVGFDHDINLLYISKNTNNSAFKYKLTCLFSSMAIHQ